MTIAVTRHIDQGPWRHWPFDPPLAGFLKGGTRFWHHLIGHDETWEISRGLANTSRITKSPITNQSFFVSSYNGSMVYIYDRHELQLQSLYMSSSCSLRAESHSQVHCHWGLVASAAHWTSCPSSHGRWCSPDPAMPYRVHGWWDPVHIDAPRLPRSPEMGTEEIIGSCITSKRSPGGGFTLGHVKCKMCEATVVPAPVRRECTNGRDTPTISNHCLCYSNSPFQENPFQ